MTKTYKVIGLSDVRATVRYSWRARWCNARVWLRLNRWWLLALACSLAANAGLLLHAWLAEPAVFLFGGGQ